MKSFKGTPTGCLGRGSWGSMKLLFGVLMLHVIFDKDLGVYGRVFEQGVAQKTSTQQNKKVDWEELKNRYLAAVSTDFEHNCGPNYGSDGGDSSNKEHRMRRRQRYIEQSRYLRRTNNARRQQQRAAFWRDSQAERAFRRQHTTFDRGKEKFWRDQWPSEEELINRACRETRQMKRKKKEENVSNNSGKNCEDDTGSG